MAEDHGSPDEARRLGAFIGTWRVEGVMSAGEDRRRITGQWVFDEAAEGWGVTGTMTTGIEGFGPMAERELIGFDSETGRIHMFSMNRITIRDHVGEWEDDTLVTRFVSDDDRAIVEEMRVRFPEAGRIEAWITEHANGQLVLTTRLTLHLEERP